MKSYKLLVALFLTFLYIHEPNAQIKPAEIAPAKTQLPANKLAGTWRLIEYANFDSLAGTWKYPYGKNPKGYFTYTKTGIVNLNVSSEIAFNKSGDEAKKDVVDLYDYSWNYAFGYFGTYSIDLNKLLITHHVKGGTVPDFIDTDQPRQFVLRGDTLIIGRGGFKKWRRVLVREE